MNTALWVDLIPKGLLKIHNPFLFNFGLASSHFLEKMNIFELLGPFCNPSLNIFNTNVDQNTEGHRFLVMLIEWMFFLVVSSVPMLPSSIFSWLTAIKNRHTTDTLKYFECKNECFMRNDG